MAYVYNNFAARKPHRKAVLGSTNNIWRSSRNAILYAEELRMAEKMKTSWLTAGATFIDIEVQELDVYEMMREIKEGGTCTVYVPDVMLLLALEPFSNRTVLKFSEVCTPTHLCPDFRRYLKLQAEVQAERYRRWPHLMIPPGIAGVAQPRKMSACTTIGSPYVTAVWDYFLSYPPGLLPDELAALLRKKKLKFLRVLPKVETIENPHKNIIP
ncbi:MAG: hypothetical protein ACO2PN_14430 [Pyrobaculum sp.]|jgi:hypothetical protein